MQAEELAVKIAVATGCGYGDQGKTILCCDAKLKDGGMDERRYWHEKCDCLTAARTALAALEP